MSNIKKGADTANISRPSKKTLEPSRESNISTTSLVEAITAFQDVLQENRLGRPHIKPDAGLQRFKLDSDKGSAHSGWYTFHTTGELYAAGFGNWKTGLNETWHYKKGNKPLSDAERRELAKVYEEAKQKRLADQQKQYKQARNIANSIWNSASPANPEHPYLVKKHIQGAAKYLRQSKDNLIVPLYKKQRLSSLQFVGKKGQKWFLKSSEIKGSFFMFGDLKKPFDTVYLAEGISTSFVIFILTNQAPVFACMNASNLKNVALSVRKHWADIEIIICADNDIREKKNMPNTGVEEAKKAALAVNGRVSIPCHPKQIKTDFNDLYCLVIESQNKNKNGVNT